MSQVELAEFSIVVLARSHNPTILNPDFLVYNGIVPEDWELEVDPICTEMVSRVVFANGVAIVTQPDRVIFTHTFGLEHPDQVGLPETVSKYVKILPHVGYRALGMNPKGYVMLASEQACQTYVESFVSPGPWRDFGIKKPKYSVRFTYEIEGWISNLTVDLGKVRVLDSKETPVVRFESNFHHEIVGENPKDRLQDLCGSIDNWEDVLRNYTNLVENVFFKSEAKV